MCVLIERTTILLLNYTQSKNVDIAIRLVHLITIF